MSLTSNADGLVKAELGWRISPKVMVTFMGLYLHVNTTLLSFFTGFGAFLLSSSFLICTSILLTVAKLLSKTVELSKSMYEYDSCTFLLHFQHLFGTDGTVGLDINQINLGLCKMSFLSNCQ